MAILRQIYIYPVKSLPGIDVEKAILGKTGLRGDRGWMLVDENNKFITLREFPSLVDFRCTLLDDQLTLTHKGESLNVVEEHYQEIITAQIWADQVRVLKATASVNDWISDILRQQISLVRLMDETIRDRSKNDGKVSLADQWPYLILSNQSVSDLNTLLEKKVSIKNFRPNLVVDVDTAYEEDRWNEFRIGNHKFKGTGKCGRCKMVDINHETGAKEGNVLSTLSSYRKEGNKIRLGLHAVSKSEGAVAVGMKINNESV